MKVYHKDRRVRIIVELASSHGMVYITYDGESGWLVPEKELDYRKDDE